MSYSLGKSLSYFNSSSLYFILFYYFKCIFFSYFNISEINKHFKLMASYDHYQPGLGITQMYCLCACNYQSEASRHAERTSMAWKKTLWLIVEHSFYPLESNVERSCPGSESDIFSNIPEIGVKSRLIPIIAK